MILNKNLNSFDDTTVFNRFVDESIDSGDISFMYQPVVDISNNKIAFSESLMRFNNDANSGGSVQALFEVLEEKGLIESEKKLRDYSLNKICKDLDNMKHVGFDTRFSLNVSAKLFDEDFCISVIDNLNKYNLSINDLIIEITENRNSDKKYFQDKSEEGVFLWMLTKAKDYGFTFAADDYENNDFRSDFLPKFNIVKTNMNFNHSSFGIDKKSEQEFANNSENVYVVERVGTQDDLDVLKSINTSGAKFFQGFFFGKAQKPLDLFHMYRGLGSSTSWDDYKRKTDEKEKHILQLSSPIAPGRYANYHVNDLIKEFDTQKQLISHHLSSLCKN